MGSPGHSVSVLEALLSLGARVAGVYTQPDKPAGRGRVQQAPPLKKFALEHGMEVFQPRTLRDPNVQEQLAAHRPDVIVVAAYGKILPREVLAIPRRGCVNVHPSLLPRYRGPSPVATAILEGEPSTGTTIMLMDEGMDTGPILASREVPIEAAATTESLTPALFELGGHLLREVLPEWMAGKVSPRPQDHSRATVTRKLEKGDGEVRWGLSARELHLRQRAFAPWPGLFTYWNGKLLKLLATQVVEVPDGTPENVPGTVVELDERDVRLGVVAGSGVLGVKRLQLEGRRPVTGEEFLRGYGEFRGSKLPS